MRILIFHGYLLRGTGSNIYNANLARALARMGHEVHLVCQERRAEELSWVNAVGDWADGDLEIRQLRPSQGPGSLTVHRPDIGALLPVYVEDEYEGFEAKAFPRLSDEELDAYLAANVAAVRDVMERFGRPEAALANHLIMGPSILARAGVPRFAVKNHGSDLEYTVKPHPRFQPYAREGLAACSAVLVGSLHTGESMWATFPDMDLKPLTGLGPPGVDTRAFAPMPEERAAGELRELARRIEGEPPSTAFGRAPGDAVAALDCLASAEGPRLVFVGKLIVSKGADLLIAAWPLIHAANPGARLLMVGFGAYEGTVKELCAALGKGDLGRAREIAAAGRTPEGGPEGELGYLASFLDSPPDGYAEMARAAAGTIAFSGRLEHDEVAEAVPACELMVVPSTFPEAFGMVAAEAAASGALPICADHSGLAEVAGALAADVPAAADLLSFRPGPGAVAEIAEKANRWLALPPSERAAIGDELASSVHRRWSWERVAEGAISASAGEVQPLVPV